MTITINQRLLLKILSFTIILVFILHVALNPLSEWFRIDNPMLQKLGRFLDLRGEANFPAWFSSGLLFLAAVLLAFCRSACAAKRPRDRPYFGSLALIFLYLSMDEMAVVHERLIWVVQSFVHLTGPLLFAWVVPYGVLMLVCVFVYWRFVFGLPPSIRTLVIVSGVVYVGAAFGMEMLEGIFANDKWTMEALMAVEDALEMTGIVLFIAALLRYLREVVNGVPVEFSIA